MISCRIRGGRLIAGTWMLGILSCKSILEDKIATPMMRWKDGPDVVTMKRLSKKLEVSLLNESGKDCIQISGL